MQAATAVKTDADALADAMPCCIGVTSDIKSYSYIIISYRRHMRRASSAKRGERFQSNEFIRPRM